MKKIVFVAAAAAIAGCSQRLPSVGPDYNGVCDTKIAYPVPDAGYPTSNLTETCEYVPLASNRDCRVEISNRDLRQWWKAFGDPELQQLVEGAATNNLSFQMSIRRLMRSNFELLGSYAAFLPQFGIGGSWVREHFEPLSSSSGRTTRYTAQQFAVDGSWEIDIFGGNRRATEMAIANAQAEGWNVADAWVEMTTSIGQKYILLRTTQERIEVARTNLVLQSETYDILKSRLDSGIGDELAVNQCAYVVEQTRARLPSMLSQEESLKNSIAILAGKVPGELHDELAKPAVRRDWLIAPQCISALPLDMLRGRPDVRRAERQLAAATAAIGVAKSAWYPKLFITGSVGWQNSGSHRLFSKDSFFSALGPSVSWPIFQGGAIYANVKAAEASMEEAALAYALALDNAYAELRNAYSAYTQEYHRYQSLQAAVKAATDAVHISQDLYKNGLKDFNNVLDAQRSRLQLEEELVISRGLITTDLIELYRTLGGGLATSDEEDEEENAEEGE